MRKVTEYLHCEKSDIAYNGEEQGLTEEQIRSIIGAIYEVEFTIDADTGTILAVNGKAFNTEEK